MILTLQEVKEAYERYNNDKVFSVLKNGKWENQLMGPGVTHDPHGYLAAKVRPLREAMGFMDYLENHYHKD